MKDQSNSHRISAAFGVMLSVAVFSMACLAGLSYSAMQQVLRSQASHSQSFVPAKKLAAAFERDILNARIHFIYFVTIQKPGTLEKGWGRYNDAESDLTALSALVKQQDELHPLSAPVAKLRADIDAYEPALRATLQMVQAGEFKGPHYDAQVKEWASLGAVMVGDAGSVETGSEVGFDLLRSRLPSLPCCGMDAHGEDQKGSVANTQRGACRSRRSKCSG
jgi:hypothetical protein